MTKYRKLIFPTVAAVAVTIAAATGAVEWPVAGGAWVVVAGVFGFKNEPV